MRWRMILVAAVLATGLIAPVAILAGSPPAMAVAQSGGGNPQPGSLLGWLECRAAASRFIQMVEQTPAYTSRDPARRAQAQQVIGMARQIDERAGRQAAVMNLTGRSAAEMEALKAPFVQRFSTPEGAARVAPVLQACEAELNGG